MVIQLVLESSVFFVVINAIMLYHHHFRFRDLKMETVDIMEGEKFESFARIC